MINVLSAGFEHLAYIPRMAVSMCVVGPLLEESVSKDAIDIYTKELSKYTEEEIEVMLSTATEENMRLRPHFFKMAIIKLIKIRFPALAE